MREHITFHRKWSFYGQELKQILNDMKFLYYIVLGHIKIKSYYIAMGDTFSPMHQISSHDNVIEAK